ncbi:hypothetical protein BC937DRAFT_94983 [Endogone sp. FLAS-F59071]|nr:hypothetical protein BC937DRAFT_94983 [Endogone sp. FLAS-F59071]|eukprot:RUS20548.1 hypothetical protein BC937DRAFT_94983 [Endogone sp. FLAS-F59071]
MFITKFTSSRPRLSLLFSPWFQKSRPISATKTPSASGILHWAGSDGEFRRGQSSFRYEITNTPDASYACPWAHRTLIVRALKGLDTVVGVSVVDPLMLDEGWKFSPTNEVEGAIPDNINGAKYLKELYFKAANGRTMFDSDPEYKGRFTVPVLWDKKLNTIVNNESSEIIRMFNTAFDDLVPEKRGVTYYPEHLRGEIDSLNEWVYSTVNDGVYKCGFATAQAAYEKNVIPLFNSLDRLEEILSKNEFLVANTFTEADIRLWTTIVRFDPVYFGHFKCNIKSIEKDYPNILRWARQLHYYMSHRQINPTQVVPLGNGPDLAFPVIKEPLCSNKSSGEGAMCHMRPDLFRALVRVPFVDPLLDPNLPLTRVEYLEWGNPTADPVVYDYIASYAPYDNISGTHAHPSILATAGLKDQRVAFWQPLKFVARMRAREMAGVGEEIVLAKVHADKGHFGAGVDQRERLKEWAFELAFLLSQVKG